MKTSRSALAASRPILSGDPGAARRITGLLGGVWMALLSLSAGSADAPPQIRIVEARLERDFGYVMGDSLRQTIRVVSAAGYRLEEEMLPQPGGAVNDWLEVRDAQWEAERRADETVYRIALTYQIFKSVRDPETLAVPALSLRFRRGEAALQADVTSLPFTLNPLIAPNTPDEAVAIRGPRPTPPLSGTRHGLRLALALAGLAGALVYGAWRLGFPPFRNRRAEPFERALRELRAHRRYPLSPEIQRSALRVFHRALNAHARRAVLEGQLPSLIDGHPELAAVREELEAFFAASHRAFFSAPDTEMLRDYPLSRLESLCRRCRTIERRHS